MNNSNSNDKRPSFAELRRLLNEMWDGNFSSEQLAQLNELLSSCEESRWDYINSVHLREGLQRWAKSQGEASTSDVVEMIRRATPDAADFADPSQADEFGFTNAAVAAAIEATENKTASQRNIAMSAASSNAHGSRYTRIFYASAAMLLVSLAFWQIRPSNKVVPIAELPPVTEDSDNPLDDTKLTLYESQTVVARVASLTPDASWSRGKEPADFLMRLRPGDIIGIDKGLAKIEFSDGAFVLLHSPGVLQINSGSSAQLFHGRVAGRAENGNFVLTTPSATVVDIGTEFGIDVGLTGTDVTVFEGEVHVHGTLSDRGSSSVRRLKQGMSVRIDPQGLPHRLMNAADFSRQLFQPEEVALDQLNISLLDLISGHETAQPRIAGSIDPATGFWGRPPWIDPETLGTQRGDTQFTQTDWNPMVDGVFIPRSNAREMQIDSYGHMVYLPANNGSTWGPIWARRRSDIDLSRELFSDNGQDHWGSGTLAAVRDRLQKTRDGLMGLHANVGITFDLDAVRKTRSRQLDYLKAVVVNLDSSTNTTESAEKPLADLRVFVDGRLRFSRLEFGRDDGNAQMVVPLSQEDRFLTIVTTDAGGDPSFDHVVLIDPILQLQPESTTTARYNGE